MTNATGTDPDQTHADPAVQALIHDGWLGIWDYPTTVDDLVNAVALVRRTDLHAAGQLVRTEWSVVAEGVGRRNEYGTDQRQAEAMADMAARTLASLKQETRDRLGVTGHGVESREVWQLPDGCELTRPWVRVRAGNPAKG